MYQSKPAWLRRRLPDSPIYGKVRRILDRHNIHTVCQEARCPNQWECFSQGTATFLILGPGCTRNCRFCAVKHGVTAWPDPDEAERLALAAKELQLSYVVITSVTRDDLLDGGAWAFVEVIAKIRKELPDALVEVLVPDFQGDKDALKSVVRAGPDVLNHNIETVSSLYFKARPEADYNRSLGLLSNVKDIKDNMPVKSGLMLGLGEESDEIETVLNDLVRHGCSMLTIGQYLQPSPSHLPVKRYLRPDEFAFWKKRALDKGFLEVASGPLVRSSYKAKEMYLSLINYKL